MPRRTDINTILIIGAGPIVIGQACEFDYSGTQGIKALKEEGYRVVLINSNPATIMTDKSLADAVYIEPITPEFIEQIIIKEKPDVILPTLGGQTALNAALKLEEMGILKRHNVGLIGVSINAIKKAEDRGLFKEAMERIGLTLPPSIIVSSFEHGFDNLLYFFAKSFEEGSLRKDDILTVEATLNEESLRDVLAFYLQNLEVKNSFYFKEERLRLERKNEGKYIDLPVIIRPSLTLGGTGGGVASTAFEYIRLLKSGLAASPIHQIQVDKSIIGWKEFEMEVVRDKKDNAIIICSIENIDPMGIHTGDSITVAPAITLTDKEYQKMRDYSLAVLREIGVETGGSNVQFAVNPKDGEIVIIEMNPRVSRSSALASKATGFPIAKIAAKLAVGYTLDELKNDIASSIPKHFNYVEFIQALEGGTGNAALTPSLSQRERGNAQDSHNTEIIDFINKQKQQGLSKYEIKQMALPASFEPTIDYVVVKIPKFNFEKFNTFNPELGTQMQSVGEVMAIGRSFEEAFLKAVSGMEEALPSLTSFSNEELKAKLGMRIPSRFVYILEGFRRGFRLNEMAEITKYDPWFLERFSEIIKLEEEIKSTPIPSSLKDKINTFINGLFKDDLSYSLSLWEREGVRALFREMEKHMPLQKVLQCKQQGFRDGVIRELLGIKPAPAGIHFFKEYRKWLGVKPVFKKIDSCGGEFKTDTNYFYSTYELGNEAIPSARKKIVIIGSGPNRVGQGIEFDYSCVHAAFALREEGIESIMINCNPETVSTDYDTSDRLFFEPLTDEHVMGVIENEMASGELLGVIIQLGGQTPLKLRQTLKAGGIKILGMEKDAIDICDNRVSFSKLVKEVGAKEAESFGYKTKEELERIAEELEYKCIIRPSAVIGGRGMAIINTASELEYYLSTEKEIAAGIVNPLLEAAIELDVDIIRDKTGRCFVFGILEHIEYAGVHSGDSSCSVIPRSLAPKILSRLEKTAVKFAEKLDMIGLINIQFAVKDEEIFVIEVNPRASRTVPFTAKAISLPVIKIAVKLMCGKTLEEEENFKNFAYKKFKDGYYVLDGINFQAVKEPVFSFEKFGESDIVRGPEMKSLGEVMGMAENFGQAFAKALIASGHKFVVTGNAFVSIKNDDKTTEALDLCKRITKLGFKIFATKGTAEFLSSNKIECEVVSKVYEGGNHIVKLIDAGQIHFAFNTTSGFKSLQDSFLIRRAIIRNKILHSTTLEGGIAVVNAIAEVKKSPLKIF